MVGGQVVKFPDYALRAYKEGHEIAMHTWTHNYMTTLTNEQIVAELKWNELAIKEAIGVSPRYFRPPYGDIDNRVRDVAAALGFAPIIWNHDTNDWLYASNPKVFQENWIDGNVTQWAKKAKTTEVGGISLEHDLYSQTVDAAIRVLPVLQSEYKLVPAVACNNGQVYKEVKQQQKQQKEDKHEDSTNASEKVPEVSVKVAEPPMQEKPQVSSSASHLDIAWATMLSLASLLFFI